MRVLVIGNGAREHALAWVIGQSPNVEAVYVAPGNGGTAEIATNLPVALDDIDGLVQAALDHQIDLTVVGPEAPLAAGIVDRLAAHGLAAAGPTAAAARIESSKSWAKEIMTAAGVPTAAAQRFTDPAAALRAVRSGPTPVVIKADGLAAGKGVIIAQDTDEAERAVHSLMVERDLGEAGSAILIEEYLTGREVSVLTLTDGETIYPLVPACDYKRLGDNDTGPNTGGMGAYAPVPTVDDALSNDLVAGIIEPVIAELRRRDIPYRGVLYAGIILTADGPKVLEFNCRFGDPETQVVLPLLHGDLAALLDGVARGRLGTVPPPTAQPGVSVGVVLASGGYPGNYTTGQEITGLDRLDPGVLAFHAGTRRDTDGTLRTAGGRVLTLVARGRDFAEARARVYTAVSSVDFTGCQYRTDIAARELG